jgi:hypothetical protein
MNAGPKNIGYKIAKTKMQDLNIHSSETAWIGQQIDYTIVNDSSVDDLFGQLEQLLQVRS